MTRSTVPGRDSDGRILRTLPAGRFAPSRASTNPPAIALSGGAIAIPVVRSLARAGIEVHAVGGDSVYDPAAHSRHCTGYTNLGGRQGFAERLREWLAAESPPGAVLLPCGDESLEFLAQFHAELRQLGHLPIEANHQVVAAMLDKERTYELAREIGTLTPRTRPVGRGLEVDAGLIEQIGFPCALKPLRSHRFAQQFGVGNKLLIANDLQELREGLRRMSVIGLDMAVTEIIPGPDTELLSYCGYLDERGEPLTHFTFRKLRQFPIHFGLGCYVVSDWDEEVIGEGLRFLRGMGLRGLFHVEFKRDPRDGMLKLLECNHRFTIEATFAPTDLPLLAYNRVLGRPIPAPRPYRPGRHLWSPLNDARAFLAYRRRDELSLGGWLRSLLHRQRFHAFRWSDPLPAVYSNAAAVARSARKRFLRHRDRRDGEWLLPSRR